MDVFKDLLSTVHVNVIENVKYSKHEHLSVEFSIFHLVIREYKVMPTKQLGSLEK